MKDFRFGKVWVWFDAKQPRLTMKVQFFRFF